MKNIQTEETIKMHEITHFAEKQTKLPNMTKVEKPKIRKTIKRIKHMDSNLSQNKMIST